MRAALASFSLASCGGQVLTEGGNGRTNGGGGTTSASSGVYFTSSGYTSNGASSGYTSSGYGATSGYASSGYGASSGYVGSSGFSGTSSGTTGSTSSGFAGSSTGVIYPVDAGIGIADVGPACPGISSYWNGYCLELIDDLETDTGFLPPVNGRDGPWFTYNDGTAGGIQVPQPYPPTPFGPETTSPSFSNPVTFASSSWSAGMAGGGFTTWGAGMGFLFLLADAQGKERPFDASAYQGIVFWGVAHHISTSQVRAFLYDGNTNYDGGACGGNGQCDPFGADVTLSIVWSPTTLLFSELKQQGYGTQYPALDPTTLYGMNFQVSQDQAFDFQIDDIYFILQ